MPGGHRRVTGDHPGGSQGGVDLIDEPLPVPALTARLLETLPVVDLAVEDPPIEAVIDQIYQGSPLDAAPAGGAGGEA